MDGTCIVKKWFTVFFNKKKVSEEKYARKKPLKDNN